MSPFPSPPFALGSLSHLTSVQKSVILSQVHTRPAYLLILLLIGSRGTSPHVPQEGIRSPLVYTIFVRRDIFQLSHGQIFFNSPDHLSACFTSVWISGGEGAHPSTRSPSRAVCAHRRSFQRVSHLAFFRTPHAPFPIRWTYPQSSDTFFRMRNSTAFRACATFSPRPIFPANSAGRDSQTQRRVWSRHWRTDDLPSGVVRKAGGKLADERSGLPVLVCAHDMLLRPFSSD